MRIAVKEDGVRRRGAPGLGPRRGRAGGPVGGRAAEDRCRAGPGAPGPGVPGAGAGTRWPGRHHGGDQALGPVVGRPAQRAYTRLGLVNAIGGDRAFEQMVLARVIEPSSKEQVPRVLGDPGLESASVRTLFHSLSRAQGRGWREAISQGPVRVTAAGAWRCACTTSPRSTSRPSVRTTYGGWVAPRRGGSTRGSSSACWSTGSASP